MIITKHILKIHPPQISGAQGHRMRVWEASAGVKLSNVRAMVFEPDLGVYLRLHYGH